MKGSHNSLTYEAPRCWWWRLVSVFWRCQRKSLAEQIAAGVRAFDIRFFYRDGTWRTAHGLVELACDPLDALTYISRACPDAIVRVILEKGDEADIARFGELYRGLERRFPTLTFYEGIYKPEWRRVVEFSSERSLAAARGQKQYYASHFSRVMGLLPGVWAWLHRYDYIPSYHSAELPICFKDFV